MVRCAIFGASGYVGGELLRLLAMHPQVTPARLFGDSQAGVALAQVHPHLALGYSDLAVERFHPVALEGIDLIFAALPHGASQKIAPLILARGIPFVDLGADFRLGSAEDYARWYGEPHQVPELLGEFVYGIPEINRDRIRRARAVAAAGCYPTSAILALKPLVDAGAIDAASIIVDAASGVSGAGKGLKESSHFNTVDENFSAYGLLNHRHTAEMEMALGTSVLFTPHLAPMNRGILATCYASATGNADPLAILRAAYADEAVRARGGDAALDQMDVGLERGPPHARRDPRTGRVLAIAALDNLVKGAAGQMIQCANLMLGLDETTGLPVAGVYP
jgi:N-acetyl-gamma-glutamyl-phosphate reductase